MKSKTIKAVIRKKIDDWLETIEDAALKEDLGQGVIVTGGCIASMLLKEAVNDYDVYLRSNHLAARVAEYYLARFQPKAASGIPIEMSVQNADDRVKIFIKSAGVASEDGAAKPYEYFEARPEGEAEAYVSEIMRDPADIQDAHDQLEEAALQVCDEGKPRYRPVFVSSNAITLSNQVQIVLRFTGDPDEIHKNYDFAHCTNSWSSWDGELVLRPAALEALLARELVYVGSKYPICSVVRLRKFLRRGWSINAGQILKMAMQISDLDLKSHEVLEDQLTGVDVAYFADVIRKIREKDPQKVNSAYLVEILDRMF